VTSSATSKFAGSVDVALASGKLLQVWIEYDVLTTWPDVTMSAVGIPRLCVPLVSCEVNLSSMVLLRHPATAEDGDELVSAPKTARSRAGDTCRHGKGEELAPPWGGEGACAGQRGDGEGKKLTPPWGGKGARTGKGGDGEGKNLASPWGGKGARTEQGGVERGRSSRHHGRGKE